MGILLFQLQQLNVFNVIIQCKVNIQIFILILKNKILKTNKIQIVKKTKLVNVILKQNIFYIYNYIINQTQYSSL